MTARPSRLWLVAATASALGAIAIAGRAQQGFYSDAALQMKTVVQVLDGRSPRVNDWIRPDYTDLSRDVDERLVVWAPGSPIAFWPFLHAGFSPAAAARSVAALAIVAGAVGWTWWFGSFGLPETLVLVFALLAPWLRVASNAMFLYSAEVLVYATVPWVLVSTVAADRARGSARWFAVTGVGLAAGSLYAVKYSATFVTAAVLAWIAARAWRSSGESLTSRVARVAVAGLATAVPIAIVSVLNRDGGGSANLITADGGGHWQWLSVLHAVAFPALTAGDLDSLLTYVLLHPAHGLTTNAIWLTVAGLPGGVLLIALAMRSTDAGAPSELARTVLAVSIVCLLTVWTLSPSISVEPRHVISAGMAMLPLAIAEGRRWRVPATAATRGILAAAALVFVAAPFGYGVVSVFAKAARHPAGYRTGPSGVYNPLLAHADAAAAVRALTSGFNPAHDVWYLTDPVTALDLPGRAIVRHADFIPLDRLRGDRFVSSRALRVHALLPLRFEANGKGAAIRAAFPQATRWVASPIEGAEVVRWTAIVESAGEQ
ncbi:MAG TPA: hypothetical protein VKE96_08400 [Vicinamibacterales bacterium]|nr:hypothetical protein [Vicinamibacterales bacterium]